MIVANLVRPTISDDAATQVTAFTDHHGAMTAGLAFSAIAVVLLTAGLVWLALTLAPHAPNLAIAGGVLGVLGSLVVLFVTGVGAAAATIVQAYTRPRPPRPCTTSSPARPSRASSRSS